MLKLRQKVYLEYSYKSKGAKLTSAIVLWDWLLFFCLPLYIYHETLSTGLILKPCLEVVLVGLMS